MKIYAPLTLASALLLTACAGSMQNNEDSQEQVAIGVHTYQCDSGETITATYPSSKSAVVQHKGNTYAMQIAISASGSRYVGSELEWWTKGSGTGTEGVLLHHKADGTSGSIIESCSES